MKTLQVTLWLYATALKQSWDCVRKNWVVSFAPVAYGIILAVAGVVAGAARDHWRLDLFVGQLRLRQLGALSGQKHGRERQDRFQRFS